MPTYAVMALGEHWSLVAFIWGQFCRNCLRYLSLVWVWKLPIADCSHISHGQWVNHQSAGSTVKHQWVHILRNCYSKSIMSEKTCQEICINLPWTLPSDDLESFCVNTFGAYFTNTVHSIDKNVSDKVLNIKCAWMIALQFFPRHQRYLHELCNTFMSLMNVLSMTVLFTFRSGDKIFERECWNLGDIMTGWYDKAGLTPAIDIHCSQLFMVLSIL